MKVQIRDAAAFRQVSPAKLSAYLESAGWTLDEIWRERVGLWIKEKDGQTRQALAPLHDRYDDYALRIGEAVTLLAEMEERCPLDVYYDLLAAESDVLRLRPLEKSESCGSLPACAALLEQARELVTAAARAAERPGLAVYRGGVSGRVEDYVRKIRPVPGYERGAELTLHAPGLAEKGAAPAAENGAFGPSFARQATRALYAGLQTAQEALVSVQDGAPLSVFAKAATKGASANLCAALAALARQSGGIAVSLAWAKAQPAAVADREFAFAESAADALLQGAEWLRQSSPFRDAPLTGEIVRLVRPDPEHYDGKAVALAELDGRPAALHVQFARADKEEVLRAFERGLEISVTGDVHREGRWYVLKNPRNFVVRGG